MARKQAGIERRASVGVSDSAARRTPTDAKEHRTVTRITTILELVAAGGPEGIGLARLADSLGAPKSSIHGLVRGLVAVGYLVNEDATYRIGPAPAALLGAARPPVEQVARKGMERLRETFDETVALSQLVGDSFVYVDMVESRQAIHYSSPLGSRHPLYPMSAGKTYLATMSDQRLLLYLRGHADYHPRVDEIVADIELVRRQGYAVNREQTIPGLSAVASSIHIGARAVWALSIAGPTERIDPIFDDAGQALCAATSEIRAQLA